MSLKWLKALRLRTLPLALSCIFLGSFIAYFENLFSPKVFFLAVLTTTLLQIVSNLANEYGDFIHGADHENREGPKRTVQSGQISPKQMLLAILFTGFFSCISGLFLIINEDLRVFIPLGLFSLSAAIFYTMGPNPYGYRGFGDIFVFLFFGIIGSFGTYYLHTHQINWQVLLPAASCGFFSTAVLNINNIRDINSDKEAGKLSIPVRIGREKAVYYHFFLLFSGFFMTFIYTFLNFNSFWQFLFLLSLPLVIKNAFGVYSISNPMKLDPFLKQMALTTLFFVLTFGIGNLI